VVAGSRDGDVDWNGDGRPDFITGKRYMAHNGSDPDEREPLGGYGYEYLPGRDGSIEWVRHIVDYAAGQAPEWRWRRRISTETWTLRRGKRGRFCSRILPRHSGPKLYTEEHTKAPNR